MTGEPSFNRIMIAVINMMGSNKNKVAPAIIMSIIRFNIMIFNKYLDNVILMNF